MALYVYSMHLLKLMPFFGFGLHAAMYKHVSVWVCVFMYVVYVRKKC